MQSCSLLLNEFDTEELSSLLVLTTFFLIASRSPILPFVAQRFTGSPPSSFVCEPVSEDDVHRSHVRKVLHRAACVLLEDSIDC